MAQANLVTKKIQMGQRDIIKFQLITYCFMKDLKLSNNELDCLTLLGAYGSEELGVFCNTTVIEKIFKTSQTVRNFLTKAVNLKLVVKNGTNKKTIQLKESLQIQTVGNIVLDYKMAYVTKEQ